jgi:anti-sigma regulatory factor (Ser/Thr protein kinase)
MITHRPYRRSGGGWHWLIPAAEMAGLARGNWRPQSDPALPGWSCLPRIATRALAADPRSVRAARNFAVAILHRWGMGERSPDIAIVVSELMTNALRHALPGSGDTGPRRPIRLGLLKPGRYVLCAVADPGQAVPAPQRPSSLDETGRGLQVICALTDEWGYTPPSESGKVVWALFSPRPAPAALARYSGRPGRGRSRNLAAWQNQPV